MYIVVRPHFVRLFLFLFFYLRLNGTNFSQFSRIYANVHRGYVYRMIIQSTSFHPWTRASFSFFKFFVFLRFPALHFIPYMLHTIYTPKECRMWHSPFLCVVSAPECHVLIDVHLNIYNNKTPLLFSSLCDFRINEHLLSFLFCFEFVRFFVLFNSACPFFVHFVYFCGHSIFNFVVVGF